MSHSEIAPSAAQRWVKCAASVPACRNLPDDESDAAREGTAAHEIGEKLLKGEIKSRGDIVGQVCENGVVYNDEMFDAAEIYYNECSILNYLAFYDYFGIESKIKAPLIHEKSHGTIDFWFYNQESKTLFLIDFKYGFVPVSPVDNWQLTNYAAGFDHLDIEKVIFKIVQPRAYGFEPVRTWSTTWQDLTPFFDQLKYSAINAFSPEPKATSGEHCKNCANLIYCEAARLSMFASLDFIGHRSNVITSDNIALNAELIELKKAQNIVEMMLEAKEAEALERLQKGENISGFEIGHARGSTKWTQSGEQVLKMAKICDVDISRPAQPLTPLQAIKAGLNEDVVKSMSEKTTGAIKLKRVDIKRTKEILNNVK
jgi:hypothetical protein